MVAVAAWYASETVGVWYKIMEAEHWQASIQNGIGGQKLR
jgi:hypothetical protein